MIPLFLPIWCLMIALTYLSSTPFTPITLARCNFNIPQYYTSSQFKIYLTHAILSPYIGAHVQNLEYKPFLCT